MHTSPDTENIAQHLRGTGEEEVSGVIGERNLNKRAVWKEWGETGLCKTWYKHDYKSHLFSFSVSGVILPYFVIDIF